MTERMSSTTMDDAVAVEKQGAPSHGSPFSQGVLGVGEFPGHTDVDEEPFCEAISANPGSTRFGSDVSVNDRLGISTAALVERTKGRCDSRAAFMRGQAKDTFKKRQVARINTRSPS